MKKQTNKTAADRPLTEAVFVSTIQELRESFATKTELKAVKEDLQIQIVDLEFRINNKFERLDEKNRGYRDEILTRIDSFAKRLVTLEEDSEVGGFQIENVGKRVAAHEKRITIIEAKNN